MNSSSSGDAEEARRLAEAASWRVRLTEAEADSSAAFEAWLAADPRNALTWKLVQDRWTFFGEQAASPELIAVRRTALGNAGEVAMNRWRGKWTTKRLRFAAAAGFLLVFASTAWLWILSRPDIYRTEVGERHVVTLNDGSQVVLDSASEVRVTYSGTSRDLALVRGQARFAVAHDMMRPFTVVARGRKVMATGTQFNVDLLGETLIVTLLEGHVVVLPDGATPAAREQPRPAQGYEARTSASGIELDVSEQLVVSGKAPTTVQRVNPEITTAWESGRLIFENEPLASAAARFGRYSNRELRIADERASELRISGVFNANDVVGFLATISIYLPVLIVTAGDGSLELRYRQNSAI